MKEIYENDMPSIDDVNCAFAGDVNDSNNPKNPEIRITDNRPAYYFRKGIMKNGKKGHKKRVKKLSNRNLMYALTFKNRMN